MSKYLAAAAALAKTATNLTEAQMALVKKLEEQIESLETQRNLGVQLIRRDEKNQNLTRREASREMLKLNAEIDEAVESAEIKIREINPSWTNGLGEAVSDCAQGAAVRSLESIGNVIGFLGRAVETATASARKQSGAFQAPPRSQSTLEALEKAQR